MRISLKEFWLFLASGAPSRDANTWAVIPRPEARASAANGALVRQIAADEGITEAELLAEAEAMRVICRAKGITGEAAMVRYWVKELDITQAELDAWTERYRAWL